MVAEHFEIDFDMILHFEAAQNFVAKHYESRFWHETPLKCSSKIGCWTLCKWFLHDFSFKGGSILGCRALWNIILTWFSPSKRLKTWLQSTTIWKKFRHDFPLYGGSVIGCRALWNGFWHDIPFKCSSKLGCRTLYNRILHDFSL